MARIGSFRDREGIVADCVIIGWTGETIIPGHKRSIRFIIDEVSRYMAEAGVTSHDHVLIREVAQSIAALTGSVRQYRLRASSAIKELQKNWDEFAKIDPLWAILTHPDKKWNRWQVDEFFHTGVQDVEAIMKDVESLGISLRRRAALDFGCGVGRLTQALAAYFDEVYGADVAPSMIELANQYNRHGAKCRYLLNEDNALRLFEDNTFDFICSFITLQHIEPEYSKNYLYEFLRVLAPRGFLVFQMPTEPSGTNEQPNQLVMTSDEDSQTHFDGPIMGWHVIKREEIVDLIEGNGGTILDIVKDDYAGPGWISLRYFATKK